MGSNTKVNLSNVDQIEGHYTYNLFDVSNHKIDFEGVTSEQISGIIKTYNLEPIAEKVLQKKKICEGLVLSMKIKGEERQLLIKHVDFSQDIGRIFLCDVLRHVRPFS